MPALYLGCISKTSIGCNFVLSVLSLEDSIGFYVFFPKANLDPLLKKVENKGRFFINVWSFFAKERASDCSERFVLYHLLAGLS